MQRHRLLSGAGNVQDIPTDAFLHMRNGCPGTADVSEEFAVDRVDEGIVGQVYECAEGGGPRIIDQNIDPTEPLGRGFHETFSPFKRSHVRWNGKDVAAGLG